MSTKSKDDEMGDRLQLVMELLEKRSKGEATNDEVETAVSSILSGMGGGIAGAASTTPSDDSRKRNAGTLAMPHPDESRIKEDMGNYDSSDDENADKSQPPKKRIRNEPEEYYEEEDENDEEIDDGRDDEEYQDTLSQIPLGKSGAQMMTTFGDGPKPVPESVSAALLGTRNCLQVAIWDARGLRRASKEDFSRARKSLGARRGGGEHTYGVDPNMLYRAITRNDKLAYDPKCGFDVEQLQKLFPEEMAAYWRWVDMRSEYESNSATDQPSIQDTEGDDKDDDGGENSESGADATETSNEPALAGQLQERAAHFDTRTMKMKKSWYLKFSKKRQGSFLPRGTRLKQSQAQIQWNKSQRGRRGRYTAGVWENMPAASVQFLHWAGFDPPALPPPDEVTTQALAFLAYNFLGKIVEKAVYLRNFEQKQIENPPGAEESSDLIEMKRGEQLTPGDIEKALSHPGIKPVPLFSMEKSSTPPSFQLYFGKGFEERLELELEEFLASETGKTLSEDETRIRKEETELFAKLAESPKVIDSVNYLMENIDDKQSKASKNE